MGTLMLIVYFTMPDLYPQLFQRIAMARSRIQVKRSLTYAAIVCLGVELCVIWIAILLLADQPGLEPSKLVQYMVNTYTYPGLRGFLGVGVMALAMSTADSILNSCAVIIANDVLPPIGFHKKNALTTAKWATIVLGVLSLLMALSFQDMLNILRGSACFYAPIVVVPMLLAIFGFETSRRVMLLAMGAGAVTTVACLCYFKSVNSFFPGMLANFSVMMGAHYLLGEKGGWGNNPFQKDAYDAARRQAWQWRLQSIRNFRLYPYLQQNLPTQESFYFFFGLYIMATTYAAFYTMGHLENKACQAMYTGVYHTVLPVTTVFLTFSIWPTIVKNKRFMAVFWPFGIGGILFFSGTLLVIMSNFHHMQVMVMMINLLMAVLLLQWPLALFLAFTGTYTAFLFFTYYTGTTLPLSGIGSLQIIYLIVLFTCLLIALKSRQVYQGLVIAQAQLKEENSFTSQVFLATVRHQARLQQEANIYPLGIPEPAERFLESIHASQAPTRAQLLASNAALHQYVYALDTRNKHLHQVLHLAQEPIHLVVEKVILSMLWQDVLKTLCQHDKTVKVLAQHNTKTQSLQGDGSKIRKLLLAAMAYAASHQKTDCPVLLGIENTQLAYPIMSIPGYVKRVEALCIVLTTERTLPRLKKWYVGSVEHPALRWPSDMEELPITYNQQIVVAHYGASDIVSTAIGVTQVYVLPINVREVRPPTMDQWQVATPVAIPATTILIASYIHISKKLESKK